MPTLNLVTKITIDDLLFVVSKLSQAEFFQFELGLVKLKQARLDTEAAQIAAAHRLSLTKQARLTTLLEKNQAESLTQTETVEIDSYLAELDQALDETANELFKLARQREVA